MCPACSIYTNTINYISHDDNQYLTIHKALRKNNKVEILFGRNCEILIVDFLVEELKLNPLKFACLKGRNILEGREHL